MDMSVELYNYKYALIKNNVVMEIALCDSFQTADMVREAKGYDNLACVDQYLVVPGDTYIDGIFHHEGNEVQRHLSLEERTTDLRSQNAQILLALVDGGLM